MVSPTRIEQFFNARNIVIPPDKWPSLIKHIHDQFTGPSPKFKRVSKNTIIQALRGFDAIKTRKEACDFLDEYWQPPSFLRKRKYKDANPFAMTYEQNKRKPGQFGVDAREGVAYVLKAPKTDSEESEHSEEELNKLASRIKQSLPKIDLQVIPTAHETPVKLRPMMVVKNRYRMFKSTPGRSSKPHQRGEIRLAEDISDLAITGARVDSNPRFGLDIENEFAFEIDRETLKRRIDRCALPSQKAVNFNCSAKEFAILSGIEVEEDDVFHWSHRQANMFEGDQSPYNMDSVPDGVNYRILNWIELPLYRLLVRENINQAFVQGKIDFIENTLIPQTITYSVSCESMVYHVTLNALDRQYADKYDSSVITECLSNSLKY